MKLKTLLFVFLNLLLLSQPIIDFLSSISAETYSTPVTTTTARLVVPEITLNAHWFLTEPGISILPLDTPVNLSLEAGNHYESCPLQPPFILYDIMASNDDSAQCYTTSTTAAATTTIFVETSSTGVLVTSSPTTAITSTPTASASATSSSNSRSLEQEDKDKDNGAEPSDLDTTGTKKKDKGKGKATDEDNAADDEDSESEPSKSKDKGKGKAIEEDDEGEEGALNDNDNYIVEFEYRRPPTAVDLSSDPDAAGPSTYRTVQSFNFKKLEIDPSSNSSSPFTRLMFGEGIGGDLARISEPLYREEVSDLNQFGSNYEDYIQRCKALEIPQWSVSSSSLLDKIRLLARIRSLTPQEQADASTVRETGDLNRARIESAAAWNEDMRRRFRLRYRGSDSDAELYAGLPELFGNQNPVDETSDDDQQPNPLEQYFAQCRNRALQDWRSHNLPIPVFNPYVNVSSDSSSSYHSGSEYSYEGYESYSEHPSSYYSATSSSSDSSSSSNDDEPSSSSESSSDSDSDAEAGTLHLQPQD